MTRSHITINGVTVSLAGLRLTLSTEAGPQIILDCRDEIDALVKIAEVVEQAKAMQMGEKR